MTKRRKEETVPEDYIAKLTGQFYSCTLLKDGGGRITFEFSADSLDAIQQIQTWHNIQPLNFAIAVKPLEN